MHLSFKTFLEMTKYFVRDNVHLCSKIKSSLKKEKKYLSSPDKLCLQHPLKSEKLVEVRELHQSDNLSDCALSPEQLLSKTINLCPVQSSHYHAKSKHGPHKFNHLLERCNLNEVLSVSNSRPVIDDHFQEYPYNGYIFPSRLHQSSDTTKNFESVNRSRLDSSMSLPVDSNINPTVGQMIFRHLACKRQEHHLIMECVWNALFSASQSTH